MTARPNRPYRSSALLAVIMCAVLLASVGVAAWVSHVRRGAVRARRQAGAAPAEHVRAAGELLEELRSRGLGAFWPDRPETLWYLERSADGRPTGWWRLRRIPRPGGFEGQVVRRTAGGYYEEEWTLDDHARRGSYQAEDFTLPSPRTRRLRRLATTVIRLDDDVVSVRREIPGRGSAEADAPAPPNYLPEGTLYLAAYVASLARRPASFSIIFNSFSLGPGGVIFGRAHVQPHRPGQAVVVYELPPMDSRWGESLRFDARGHAVSGQNLRDGNRWELVNYEQVRRLFPEAEKVAAEDARRDAEDATPTTTAPETP